MNRLWTKFYILMLGINLIYWIMHYMMFAIIPGYTMAIGGNETQVGLMAGVFTISSLLGRPIFGRLVDTIGRRIIMIGGAVVMIGVLVTYPIFTTLMPLLVLRFLHGFGFSAFSTAAGTVVADVVPPARLSEGIGYFSLGTTFATAIGPALALALMANDIKTAFYAAAGLAIAGLIAILTINYEKKNPPTIKKDIATGKKELDVEGIFFKVFPISFFLALGMGSILSFMTLFGGARGIENIGLFFTVNAIFLIISRTLTGRLADRIGYNRVMMPSFILGIVGFFILAFSYELWQVLIAAAIYGIGYGSMMPILNAILVKACKPEHRGMANAVHFAAIDLGVGVGAILLGFISQIAGYVTFFLTLSAFALVAMILYMVLLMHKKTEDKSTGIVEI